MSVKATSTEIFHWGGTWQNYSPHLLPEKSDRLTDLLYRCWIMQRWLDEHVRWKLSDVKKLSPEEKRELIRKAAEKLSQKGGRAADARTMCGDCASVPRRNIH